MNYNYYKERYTNLSIKSSAGELEHFVSKFECRVEDSREYNQYVRQSPFYHRDFYATDNFKMDTQVTPMKAIHLTSENLARLVAEQEHIQRLTDDAEYGKKCWTHERKDQIVRNENPAVEKAYQKYVMLLELARK